MPSCPACQREFRLLKTLCSHFSRVEVKKFASSGDAYHQLMIHIDGVHSQNVVADYVAGNLCSWDITKSGYKIVVHYLRAAGLIRSHSEEKRTNRYRSKMEATILEKYGVKNVSQSFEIKDKKKETVVTRYGDYEEYLRNQREMMIRGYREYIDDENRTKDTKAKVKETCQERYGVDNPSQIPLIKLKISKSQRERLAKLSDSERRLMTEKARLAIKRDLESSIEIRIQRCLEELDIPYEKHVFVGNRNYDLLIFDNLLIEVNGDYWHANPSIYQDSDMMTAGQTAKELWRKDEYKKMNAEGHGFRVLSFWESDIRTRSDEELIPYVQEILQCSK